MTIARQVTPGNTTSVDISEGAGSEGSDGSDSAFDALIFLKFYGTADVEIKDEKKTMD